MVRAASQKTLNKMSGRELRKRLNKLVAEENKLVADFFKKKGEVNQRTYTKRRTILAQEIGKTKAQMDKISARLKAKHAKRKK